MEDKIIAPKPTDPKGPWDVIIIGSGPSGLTAAIYTTRGAASTLILGGEVWGGQLMLTTTVDNFPGFPEGIQGPDLMENMRKQAERFGAKFMGVNVTSIDLIKKPFEISAGGVTYLARSIIIATGAQITWLDASGVKELIGKGVSSCAPCDAPFFRGRKVAVVGGGDSAMEEALVLTKYASEVTIIHRRDEFRASAVMQEKVKTNPKIKILWNSEVSEARGAGKLESLVIRNNKTGEMSEIPFDGLFVAIGHKPASDVFAGQVEVDEKGYIKPVDWHCGTNVKGVFIAGDVMDKDFKQAIVSAGMGCIAGMEALKYLGEEK
ncbi:MAG: thioredoxin-disulfide reductase [Candidatus Microgenomates bacterium]|jgi:thioredoxin reductase (NADPH)